MIRPAFPLPAFGIVKTASVNSLPAPFSPLRVKVVPFEFFVTILATYLSLIGVLLSFPSSPESYFTISEYLVLSPS